MILDVHLKFRAHVDHIIDKTKHSLYVIKLPKAGVQGFRSLGNFYNTICKARYYLPVTIEDVS